MKLLKDIENIELPNNKYNLFINNTKMFQFFIYILNYFGYIFSPFKKIYKRFKVAYKNMMKMYVHGFRFRPHVPLYKVQYYSDRRGFVVAINNLWYFLKYLHLFTIEDRNLFIIFLEFHLDLWKLYLENKNFRLGLEKKIKTFYIDIPTQNMFGLIPKETRTLIRKDFVIDLLRKLRHLIELGNPYPSFLYSFKPRKNKPKKKNSL